MLEIDANQEEVAVIGCQMLQRVRQELENTKLDPLWIRHYTLLEKDPEGPSDYLNNKE
jgi:hypothetical protein